MRPNAHLPSISATRVPKRKPAMSKKPAWSAVAAVFVVVAFSSVGALLSGPAAAAKDTMADCAKFVDGWKAAYNARNADALAGMYEPKRGTYSSVFWTGTGQTVLAQAFKQELATGSTMTSIKCDRSNAAGDVITSSGTWSASSTGPDGKPMAIGGHWQSLAMGRGGKYLIVDHISNMQLPPPR